MMPAKGNQFEAPASIRISFYTNNRQPAASAATGDQPADNDHGR
jgi:hypothetical protein